MQDQIEARLASLRAEMRDIETRLGTAAEHPDDMETALRLGHEAVNMLQVRLLRSELRGETADVHT